jgi:hypothetical protein
MKKLFLLHSPFIHSSCHVSWRVLVIGSLLPSMYICVCVYICVCIYNMYVCMYVCMYFLRIYVLSFFMDLYVCILAKSGTCYLLTSLFLACSICLIVFLVFLAPSVRNAIVMNHTILCSDSGNVHKNKHYSGGFG